MFAYIKYLGDNKTETVSSEYIKNFKAESKDDYVKGKKISVFWSPKGLTPDEVFRKQGVIPDIDELPDKKRKHLKSLDGWYLAELLHIAETEEELDESVGSHRVKKLSRKAFDLVQEKVEAKKKKDCTSGESSSKGKTPAAAKALIDESAKRNINAVMKPAKKSSTTKRRRHDQPSTSESEDEVKPVRSYEKKIKSLKESNTDLRNKLTKRNGEKETLEKLLKQKEEEVIILRVELAQAKSQGMKSGASPVKILKTTPTRCSPRLKEKEMALIDVSPVKLPVKKLVFDDEEKSAKSDSKSNFEDAKPKNKGADDLNKCDKSEQKEEGAAARASNTDDSNWSPSKGNVTMEQFKAANKNAGKGKPGDSKFVYSLAVTVFSREVLALSSVTGKPCPSQDHSKPKPELPKEGLKYLKTLFEKRLTEEGIPEESFEWTFRLGQLNKLLKKKIQMLIRPKTPNKKTKSP